MILITKPFLPPLEEYEQFVRRIWQRNWLTNMGPLSNELEEALKRFLQVDQLLYISSGTIGLQMAIKALALKGEIITTPFSFVATASSIVWEGCTPVFVDIDARSLNIDADKIEAAITSRTSAILATHVYGNPCAVEKIQAIASKHQLKIIYDAAHAFAVTFKGKSVFTYGDVSVCSLQATKWYHSTEGGLLITNQPALMTKLSFMRNFGFNGPETFEELGINGKNSEFHAAMGLVNLNYVDTIREKRAQLSRHYDQRLKTFNATKPIWNKDSANNYSYYPLIFETETLLLACKRFLEQHDIFTRRYFYPALNQVLPYVVSQQLPVAEEISKRVLCLPLYYELTLDEVDLVCNLLLKVQKAPV